MYNRSAKSKSTELLYFSQKIESSLRPLKREQRRKYASLETILTPSSMPFTKTKAFKEGKIRITRNIHEIQHKNEDKILKIFENSARKSSEFIIPEMMDDKQIYTVLKSHKRSFGSSHFAPDSNYEPPTNGIFSEVVPSKKYLKSPKFLRKLEDDLSAPRSPRMQYRIKKVERKKPGNIKSVSEVEDKIKLMKQQLKDIYHY